MRRFQSSEPNAHWPATAPSHLPRATATANYGTLRPGNGPALAGRIAAHGLKAERTTAGRRVRAFRAVARLASRDNVPVPVETAPSAGHYVVAGSPLGGAVVAGLPHGRISLRECRARISCALVSCAARRSYCSRARRCPGLSGGAGAGRNRERITREVLRSRRTCRTPLRLR